MTIYDILTKKVKTEIKVDDVFALENIRRKLLYAIDNIKRNIPLYEIDECDTNELEKIAEELNSFIETFMEFEIEIDKDES